MKKNRVALSLLLLSSAMLLVSSCSDKDKKHLPGERLSVLELQKSLQPDNAIDAEPLSAPSPWQNEFWPQAGGYPNHAMQHLALPDAPLKKIWSTSIGEGASDKIPLSAQPIIADGRIFTLDSEDHLRAFDISNGKQIWKKNVVDEGEDEAVIGGGIAFAGGVLYVTAGYNEILALNPVNGEVFWRVALPTTAHAAPTVMDGRVFVLTSDNRLLALDATSGALLWDYIGISESAGLVGAASPAANRDIVIPAFSSGELTALRVVNGAVAWSDNLSNVRRMGGLESISDIRALPVIDNGIIIAISFSGRLVAIDERTGTRIWQREIGGAQTPWVAGNYVFIISTDNELVALNRENGAIHWVSQLPKYEDPDDLEDKIIWTGPVLAGNRLISAGSNGHIVETNPTTGEIISDKDFGSAFAIPPVVAGGVLYLLDDDGNLTAWQ